MTIASSVPPDEADLKKNGNCTYKDNSDLYPDRRRSSKKRSGWDLFTDLAQRKQIGINKCEENVFKVAQESSLIKLLLAALKSSGCEIDLRRHIVCETCDTQVTGGYDSDLNQVVICQNTATSEGMVQGALSHELIHMFDHCRNKVDFQNIDHIACTEIRAANIGHCSFLGSWIGGLASPFNVKQAHQDCVKDRAMRSIMAVRNVTEDEATAAVLRVFDRCYNDLEPVGRRLRRNSDDMRKAYLEGPYYGYAE